MKAEKDDGKPEKFTGRFSPDSECIKKLYG